MIHISNWIFIYREVLLLELNISIDSPESKVINRIIDYLYYHFFDYDNGFLHYGIALSLLDEINQLNNHIDDVWNKMEK